MRAFQIIATGLLAASQATAKAVFAHFMIGNTAQYTVTDFVYDMQLAQQAHIDGFALNMAYLDEANDKSVPLAFQAATQVPGFKLFFSFDYAGNGPWPMETVSEMISTYGPKTEYFHHSTGQPLVSTFEGPSNAEDWDTIKSQTGCYFVPSWSSLGAKKAVNRANHVVDGLFNWGAWPEGTTRTNWDLDASYMIFLNNTGTYMASVSPWFFTNMPGYSKNWLWRGDSLWFDRWQQLWSLSSVGKDQWPGEPEYIQIISWNDYGESHYIGPLNDKAYVAFGADYGNAPFNYAKGMPHDGWRQLLPFMIEMWKTGTATVTQEALVSWYRLAPGRACDSGGTTGNTVLQLQTEVTPWSLAQDKIFYAALSTKVLFPRITIGNSVRIGQWDSCPDGTLGNVGICYGSIDFDGATGDVLIELVDDGGVVASIKGAPISATCANSVQNWNAWVGSATGNRAITPAAPTLTLSEQECTEGAGSKAEYNDLCEWSCSLGYCPPGPCTCYKMGLAYDIPTIGVQGYAKPGLDCTYTGLCSFACDHDHCLDAYCTDDPSAAGQCIMPVEEPDPDDSSQACTAGTGSDNFAGLCSFSCGRGYCPVGPCKCTGIGSPITPPAATDDPGYPVAGLGIEYKGLCNFACSRGYCPSGACTYTNPYGGIFIENPSCSSSDENSVWSCEDLTCTVAGSGSKTPKQRWDSVGTSEFFDYTVKWFGAYNDFNPNPATGAQPFDGTNWEDNPVDAIAYYFAGEGKKGGTSISTDLACGTISSAGGCSDPQDFVCGTTDYPALDLLLTSFANIHNFYTTMYDSLDSVESNMAFIIESVAATFWEEPVSILQIFLGIMKAFAFILDIAGASFWGRVLNIGSFESVSDSIGTASEAVGFFNEGFSSIAEKAEENAVSEIDVQSDLKKAAATFFQQTRKCLDSWMKNAFYTNWNGYQKLGTHLTDGLFLLAPRVSSYDFYEAISPVVTGFSIVETWRKGSYSGVVAVIYAEGDKSDPGSSIILGDASKMRVKVPDGDYTLWLVVDHLCGGSGGSDCNGGASAPTGIEELADADNEWGLTKDDIALSAFYGFMLNKQKNPFPVGNKNALGLDPSNTGPLPYTAGLRTPGVFQIPVCDAATYKKNLVKDQLSKDKKCDYYPCCEY